MKKFSVVSFILVFLLTGSSLLWAGGADNKTNWSAEYVGILNRNAATDAADIVMYNPAGVMEMENGFYGNLSAHYIAKEYNNELNGTDFDQDEPSLVPGLFTVYKQDRWAAFLGVSNVVGGGKVEFKSGNATTNLVGFNVLMGTNAVLAETLMGFGILDPTPFLYTGISSQNLNAEAMGIAYTIGGAFSINDMWSVSLGLRYLKSEREMDGSITIAGGTPLSGPFAGANDPRTIELKFEEEADGFGGVIGINFAPNDKLNIGLHYDTEIELDYEADVKKDLITPNGSLLASLGVVDNKERSRNLPAVVALGVSHQCTPKFRVETNLTYYLNESANFKDIAGTPRDESAVDNGFDLGIGFDYAVTDTLNIMCGYLYTNTGVDKAADMTPELPELDAHTIGAGLGYQMTEDLKFTFSLGHVFYDDASYISAATGAKITYEKDITFVGIGVEYKFF